MKLKPFFRVGITTFGEQMEEYGECHSLVCYSKHERIDFKMSELPIRPIHGQHIRAFMGKKTEYDMGNQVQIQGIAWLETLDTSHTWEAFRFGFKSSASL